MAHLGAGDGRPPAGPKVQTQGGLGSCDQLQQPQTRKKSGFRGLEDSWEADLPEREKELEDSVQRGPPTQDHAHNGSLRCLSRSHWFCKPCAPGLFLLKVI